MMKKKRAKRATAPKPLMGDANQFRGILVSLLVNEAESFNRWRRHCEKAGISVEATLEKGVLRVTATVQST